MLLHMQPTKYKSTDGKWLVEDGMTLDGQDVLKTDVETALNSGMLDLLTLSANKNNCKSYRKEHDDTMPVGIKYQTKSVVQIQKSKRSQA